MKSAIRLALLAALAVLALGIGGCKKGVDLEEVCGRFAEGDEVQECVEEINNELEECTNRDDVLECMREAQTEYAIEGCFETCQSAE